MAKKKKEAKAAAVEAAVDHSIQKEYAHPDTAVEKAKSMYTKFRDSVAPKKPKSDVAATRG